MTEQQARDTLFPTVRAEVSRYQGRIKAWVAANEVTDEGGIRTNVPWYGRSGPSTSPRRSRSPTEDPGAILVLNEFGFEQACRFTRRESRRT